MMGPMMKMYFHIRVHEYILFNGWLPNDVATSVLSCIAIFTIAAGYEALCIALCWMLHQQDQRYIQSCAGCENTKQQVSNSTPNSNSYQELLSGGHNIYIWRSDVMLSKSHIAQTILYGMKVFISLSLMMIAMTYNVPLFLSMIAGHIFAYFLLTPLVDHQQKNLGAGGDCCF